MCSNNHWLKLIVSQQKLLLLDSTSLSPVVTGCHRRLLLSAPIAMAMQPVFKKARVTSQQASLSFPGMTNPLMAMMNPMAAMMNPAMMNPGMMNPAMAAMMQQMSNHSAPSGIGATMSAPVPAHHVEDAVIVEAGGEDPGEDGGDDEEHGEDVPPEGSRPAATPKTKAAPPASVPVRSAAAPMNPFEHQTDDQADVIGDAMTQIMNTRKALFKASKGEMPIPRCIKFVGALPKAHSV